VANGEGHQGLRRVASLVAKNIQVRTEEARAGQVTEGQWQQIAEAMQSVRSSDRAGAANAARRSSIGTGSSFSPPGSASRTQRGRPVARATLAGDYDAATSVASPSDSSGRNAMRSSRLGSLVSPVMSADCSHWKACRGRRGFVCRIGSAGRCGSGFLLRGRRWSSWSGLARRTCRCCGQWTPRCRRE
jgi:hypothetical protein